MTRRDTPAEFCLLLINRFFFFFFFFCNSQCKKRSYITSVRMCRTSDHIKFGSEMSPQRRSKCSIQYFSVALVHRAVVVGHFEIKVEIPLWENTLSLVKVVAVNLNMFEWSFIVTNYTCAVILLFHQHKPHLSDGWSYLPHERSLLTGNATQLCS